jgi:PAS domain S-box-containing protein
MSLDDAFAGGGQVGAQMRELDWTCTPLGPPSRWPPALKTCVRILLTSRQPMFVWWGEPLIHLYNDAYRAILGGKHPAALARPVSEVWREIWDEVGPRAAAAIRAREGTSDEARLVIMERDGASEEAYATFSYSPVVDDQGGPGGLLGAVTDDTARIVGDRQLALLRDLTARTAEARTLADTIGHAAAALAGATRDLPFAAIYLRTAGGRLELARPIGIAPAALAPIEASPAFAAMIDAPALRVLPADPAWALPTGAWPRAPYQIALLPIASTSERGRSGVLVVGANPFRRLDETYRGFLELVAGQLAARLVGVELDACVTEQVHARRALELSEGRLRRVIESNMIGFASIDLDGRVLDANDSFLTLLGVTRDEVHAGAIRVDDFTPAEDLARSLAARRELRDAGVCEPYEKSYVRRDGRRVPVVVGSTLVPSLVPMPGGGREAISFVLDISTRKRMEELNLVLRAQAESANRAKDEFLAMLGHELRNPLAPILTALNLMRLRGNDTVERERTVIERQAQHLVHLVDDLLDVSRITRGKIELRRARVELAEVVARAIEMASPLIEQRRHALAVHVAARGLALDADPARLAQVVANLLTNAAKYTEPGGRIVIHAARGGDQIELTVRDTGIGIAPDMLPHVFDLFVQEHQTLARSQGGLGLGLAIVRSLVELHGGTVAVASHGHGHGSEFVIHLPAADEPVVGAAPVLAVGTDRRPAIAARRILVVDDNEDAAALLAEYLEAMGNTIRVAHDGAQALRVLEDFVPELALLDIGLPVMDGYELAQHLRARFGHERLKLIAVTGYGQESDRQKAKAASFDAHLVKPIDFARLDRLLTGA